MRLLIVVWVFLVAKATLELTTLESVCHTFQYHHQNQNSQIRIVSMDKH